MAPTVARAVAVAVVAAVVLRPGCAAAGRGTCDVQRHYASIASEIAETTSQAASRYGCPQITLVDCPPAWHGGEHDHGGGNPPPPLCQFEVDDTAAAHNPSCRWTHLTERLSMKISRRRTKALKRYGCDAASRMVCHSDERSWWSCNKRTTETHEAPADGKAGARSATPGRHGSRCVESKLLAEIAEELAEALGHTCPRVASVVCPAYDLHREVGGACRFGVKVVGVKAAQAMACPGNTKLHATAMVMKELGGAHKAYGCPTSMQVVCVRRHASPPAGGGAGAGAEAGWIFCEFVEGSHPGAPPEGHYEL